MDIGLMSLMRAAPEGAALLDFRFLGVGELLDRRKHEWVYVGELGIYRKNGLKYPNFSRYLGTGVGFFAIYLLFPKKRSQLNAIALTLGILTRKISICPISFRLQKGD